MSKMQAIPLTGMQQMMMGILLVITGVFFTGVANAAPTIRAEQGAKFWGEITSDGQHFACWQGFVANAIGDFGDRDWLHPLKGRHAVQNGCVPLYGDGSFNLYRMADVNDAQSRRALLVVSRGGDGLNLGRNICRTDDQGGHGSKLLVTNPSTDTRCVK